LVGSLSGPLRTPIQFFKESLEIADKAAPENASVARLLRETGRAANSSGQIG
jgi:hypothetical protein